MTPAEDWLNSPEFAALAAQWDAEDDSFIADRENDR
jgi:hypothetical protein